jgi:hypothetical protein
MSEYELQLMAKTIDDLAGQVVGLIAILEEMDGLPKSKKDAIKQKLAGTVTPIFSQGNPRASAEATVDTVLKGFA